MDANRGCEVSKKMIKKARKSEKSLLENFANPKPFFTNYKL